MGRHAWVGVFLLAGCVGDPSSTLQSTADGHFIAHSRDGQVRRVYGAWTLAGGELGAAASQFVELHRDALGIDASLTLAAPRVLEPFQRVVSVDLERDGHRVYGGTLRVHTGGTDEERSVLSVAVHQPRGYVELSSDPVDLDRASSLAIGDSTTLEVDGEPELMWLSTGMLVGAPDDAQLTWRVPLRDELDPERDAVVWLDATDGTERWRERRHTSLVQIWDADDLANRFNALDMRDRSLDFENGMQVSSTAPDPEAVQANTFATESCAHIENTFTVFREGELMGERRGCEALTVIVDGGDDGAYAAASCQITTDEGVCTEVALEFGRDVLVWSSGRRTFDHELWHGLVSATAPLAHGGLPGAVNEAYADIGSIAFWRPSGPWLLTHGSVGEPHYEVLRNLTAPLFEPDDPSRQHLSHHDQLGALDPATLLADDDTNMHAIGVILSHGMWRAVEAGGMVFDRRWEPIGYDKAEQILYRAVVHGAGPARDLRDAAEDLVHACVSEVLLAREFGEPGIPGLRASDCGALHNAMAEVGLMGPDRDLDGIGDDDDTCPDLPNIEQLLIRDSVTESGCETASLACPSAAHIYALDDPMHPFRVFTEDVGPTSLLCRYVATGFDGGGTGGFQIHLSLEWEPDVGEPIEVCPTASGYVSSATHHVMARVVIRSGPNLGTGWSALLGTMVGLAEPRAKLCTPE